MTVTEQQLLTWLASFIWPFFRIGSMFISVPIFSGQRVPARIRVMLAVMITFVMMPVLPPHPPPIQARHKLAEMTGTAKKAGKPITRRKRNPNALLPNTMPAGTYSNISYTNKPVKTAV